MSLLLYLNKRALIGDGAWAGDCAYVGDFVKRTVKRVNYCFKSKGALLETVPGSFIWDDACVGDFVKTSQQHMG